ncbi:DUF2975 domain-containing protein [Listeria costaricensis]|uniref:DUF2975 domain-containing protein n=1 Tax=Listeria costaricensis TaxID=2026604 RepID=UPI000C08B985|nr:DUF2975 domain-containing protein [Listeria costaricensis]
MKKETLFLKIVIILIGLFILTIIGLGFPAVGYRAVYQAGGLFGKITTAILTGLTLSAIPFFTALYQGLKLLSYIDRNEAFSTLSIRALKIIKNCALIDTIIYLAILPFFYIFADKDDSPGFLAIGLVLFFACLVISVFTTVLQKLFISAVKIKSENDLTV